MVLDLAVKDRRLPLNPAADVTLPPAVKPDKRFLTAEELYRLAEAAAPYPIPEVGKDYRALILLLGTTGLRWAEMAGLRVGRVVTCCGDG